MSTKGAVTVVMSFLDLRAPRNHYLHGNTQNPVIKEKKKKNTQWVSKTGRKEQPWATWFFFFFPQILLCFHGPGCSWKMFFYTAIHKWHGKGIWLTGTNLFFRCFFLRQPTLFCLRGGKEQRLISILHVVESLMSSSKMFSYKGNHIVTVIHWYNIKIYYHFNTVS